MRALPSSAHNLSSTAAASTSTPSRLTSVTSTEQHCEPCCANVRDEECASSAPTCAEDRWREPTSTDCPVLSVSTGPDDSRAQRRRDPRWHARVQA
jgi:hypothetical protein